MNKKYEVYSEYQRTPSRKSYMQGKLKTTKGWTFVGHHEMPKNIDDLKTKRIGRFLYVEYPNGNRERYTMEDNSEQFQKELHKSSESFARHMAKRKARVAERKRRREQGE